MSRPDPYLLLAERWGLSRADAKYRAYTVAWGLPGTEQWLADMRDLDAKIWKRLEATSGIEPE